MRVRRAAKEIFIETGGRAASSIFAKIWQEVEMARRKMQCESEMCEASDQPWHSKSREIISARYKREKIEYQT